MLFINFEPINQSINQSINQAIIQSINQSSINQLINQSIKKENTRLIKLSPQPISSDPHAKMAMLDSHC